MKAKPKKPRRVVLGVGHPWFGYGGTEAVQADTVAGRGSGYRHGWLTVELKDSDDRMAATKVLRISGLGLYNKIRLVAEVLK